MEYPVIDYANQVLPENARVLCLSIGDRTYYVERSVHLAEDFYVRTNGKFSETELLQKINRGFPASVWQPYKQLIAKRNDETLAEDEYQQLITLSDQLEEMNVERMGYLIELSQLRKQPLRKVMDDLGIHPLSHE